MSGDRIGRALSIIGSDQALYDVEKAKESVRRSLPVVGLLYDDGVVVVSRVWETNSELMNKDDLRRVYKLSDEATVGYAGRSTDAFHLVQNLREKVQTDIGEFDRIEDLDFFLNKISEDVNEKSLDFTVRNFGVSLLVGGYDGRDYPSLYCIDPSGEVTSWNAYAVGSGYSDMIEQLEEEYSRDMNRQEALELALDVLSNGDEYEPHDVQGTYIESDTYSRIENSTIRELHNGGDSHD